MVKTKVIKNDEMRVGVIGATSFIAEYLFPLLMEVGSEITAFSRSKFPPRLPNKKERITWTSLQLNYSSAGRNIEKWIYLAPIWTLTQHLPLLLSYHAKHIVVVSSTSRFTKELSSDEKEKKLAKKIAESEEMLIKWAGENNITWTILRPTLVYALGRDKNISVIIRFIKRFYFFPLVGEGKGLRQPVHAYDVAAACVAALSAEKAFNRSYNISGGETLTYRQMVEKVFKSLGKKTRFVILPLWLFRIGIFALRLLPCFRYLSPAMAERMNRDLVFDNNAIRELNFVARNFVLNEEDVHAKKEI
ncbi:MAG: NAD-dependent epimerase/dehydratase family protein [Syntrophaceae bacterium]|nr:NAD-dependent epimerase/dehydratase family protein [Syntrophaceae bacterium]